VHAAGSRCNWQQGRKKQFFSSPPFSAVLTIDQTLKCQTSNLGCSFEVMPHPIGLLFFRE
jgi:hypothetical protein